MTTQEKNRQLKESIKHYHLYEWITPCPGGFQTLKTGSGSKIFALMLLAAALMLMLYFKVRVNYDDDAPTWFWWLAGTMILLMLARLVFTVYRYTIFDLEAGMVRVEILGWTSFQRPFRAFEKFSFDRGVVINGVDPGGTLYMHFKGGGKLRLAQLRDPNTLNNLQHFVIEAINLSN